MLSCALKTLYSFYSVIKKTLKNLQFYYYYVTVFSKKNQLFTVADLVSKIKNAFICVSCPAPLTHSKQFSTGFMTML